MNNRPTPETDAFITSQDYSPTEHQWRNFTRKLERERDEAKESLKHIEEYGTEEINAAVELRQKLAQTLIERDEAITRRMETIMQCELYEQERDEARKDLEFRRELYKVQEECLENAKRERDEAREKYDTLAVENMLAINKLYKERDEWAAMCGTYKQERDEAIQLLKLCANHTITTYQEEAEKFLQRLEETK